MSVRISPNHLLSLALFYSHSRLFNPWWPIPPLTVSSTEPVNLAPSKHVSSVMMAEFQELFNASLESTRSVSSALVSTHRSQPDFNFTFCCPLSVFYCAFRQHSSAVSLLRAVVVRVAKVLAFFARIFHFGCSWRVPAASASVERWVRWPEVFALDANNLRAFADNTGRCTNMRCAWPYFWCIYTLWTKNRL